MGVFSKIGNLFKAKPQTVEDFIATIAKNLPKINLKPADMVRVGGSDTRLAGAATFGSSAAYSAIAQAMSGSSDKQLAEAKAHTKLLGQIKDGVVKKAPKAKI